jgi:hypothetical protein
LLPSPSGPDDGVSDVSSAKFAILGFLILATALEVFGDAIVRMAWRSRR